jgi:hypothetical protein
MCSIGAIHHPPIEVSVFLHSFKIKNAADILYDMVDRLPDGTKGK